MAVAVLQPNGVERTLETRMPLAGSLLLQVANGDPGAVRACIDAYGGLVWSLTRRLVKNDADVEEVVQDVFVELWKSAKRFDPRRSSERGFVAMITRRRAVDRLRRSGKRPPVLPLEEEVDAATEEHVRTEGKAGAAHVVALLENLPEDRRRFVMLSVVYGMSHSEIAKETGAPIGTIKSGIRRALAAMRKDLAEREGRGAGQ